MVWLRVAVAVLLFRDSIIGWNGGGAPFIPVALGIAAILLVLGLFTPAISLIGAVLEAVKAIPFSLAGWPIPFLIGSVLGAIAILGPGAYSLDAFMFGRRKIKIGPPTQ